MGRRVPRRDFRIANMASRPEAEDGVDSAGYAEGLLGAGAGQRCHQMRRADSCVNLPIGIQTHVSYLPYAI